MGQCMAIEGIILERLRRQYQTLAFGGGAFSGGDADLSAKRVRSARLTLGDASDFWGGQGRDSISADPLY